MLSALYSQYLKAMEIKSSLYKQFHKHSFQDRYHFFQGMNKTNNNSKKLCSNGYKLTLKAKK